MYIYIYIIYAYWLLQREWQGKRMVGFDHPGHQLQLLVELLTELQKAVPPSPYHPP
jgi:hypothetical protein